VSHQVTARQFGVSQPLVRKIRYGEIWRHLLPTAEEECSC
jgi:hypothetical protein